MHERILVTGGAGFIGSSTAIALRRRFPEARITAFDNLHRRGSELNLPRLAAAGVRFVHGDIRSPEDLHGLAEPPELIIECSAEPSAQSGYGGSPEYLVRTNLIGCFHCLELARAARADFLFVSTSRVYPFERLNRLRFSEADTRFVLCAGQEIEGASEQGIAEEFPLDGARSLYGMTKLASELMVTEYAAAYGLRCVINRCGLIAGPWQMGKTDQGVVALWAAAHSFGQDLDYIGFGGAGKQVRDILHIDDWNDLVIDQVSRFDLYAGGLFNAGGGLRGSLSLCEMTALCREITGSRIHIGSIAEDRPADVRLYITDHSRLTRLGNWSPRRDAATTLADICAWLRREERLVRPVLFPQAS